MKDNRSLLSLKQQLISAMIESGEPPESIK